MPPQEAAQIAPGAPASLRATDNPFVQAMQTGPQPLPPVAQAGPPRPSLTPPIPEATRPLATAPEKPGADDRRYFPQLKRF
jgi:hypothetical protein